MSFHQRCGSRIHLSNLNHTARRNINDFNHGIVLSSEPMVDEVWFQVRIDEKVCFAQMCDVVAFFPSLARASSIFYSMFYSRHKHGMELWKSVLHV